MFLIYFRRLCDGVQTILVFLILRKNAYLIRVKGPARRARPTVSSPDRTKKRNENVAGAVAVVDDHTIYVYEMHE